MPDGKERSPGLGIEISGRLTEEMSGREMEDTSGREEPSVDKMSPMPRSVSSTPWFGACSCHFACGASGQAGVGVTQGKSDGLDALRFPTFNRRAPSPSPALSATLICSALSLLSRPARQVLHSITLCSTLRLGLFVPSEDLKILPTLKD